MSKDIKTILMIIGACAVVARIYREGQKSVREGRA